MSIIKLFSLFILLIVVAACNNGAGDKFGALDGKVDDGSSDDLDKIEIASFTPTSDPTILTNSTSAVFGVLVTGNVGNVTYDFILDNDTNNKLATGSDAFLNILGSSLVAGDHEVKVIASNGKTSDEKIFNVKKNHIPTILLKNPAAATGETMNCGDGPKKFSGLINDLDISDNYIITWELDSQVVTTDTPYISRTDLPNYSEIDYEPDCTQAGTHTLKFSVTDGYDTTETSWTFTVNNPPPEPNSVQITSWIPTTSPVIMTGTSETTFGVSIAEGAGTVNYKFYLDNEEVQDGGTSFYSLSGSALMAGFHSLRVLASNGLTSDEKSFNIRKNTPPSVTSYTPALTGNTISCSGGTVVLDANFGDVNNDAVSIQWKMDEALVDASTDFVSVATVGSNTKLTYTPDCTDVGFHSFKLILNDGYETFDQTWTVSVNNPPAPPGNVQILTFTPTVDPIVVTANTSTTFAVSIADGAGPVTYEFKRDGVEVLQNGSDPFYILDGSVLSTGTHTIRVRGTNATSSDEKTFNIRRNSLPNYIVYSPSTTGESVNCGNTITFDATVVDTDPDTLTKSWLLDNVAVTNSDSGIVISSTTNTARLVYTTDCDETGVHTITIRTNDGYEASELTWTFTVNNPAQEALGTTTPSGTNIVALSTEVSKTFTAIAATGIPPYTFKWYLKRAGLSDQLIKTETAVNSSSLIVNTSDLNYGDQEIEVRLTDSTTANDPVTPAERLWNVYKNQKPLISNKNPALSKRVNSNSSTTLSAIVTDENDTFTTTIMRGSTLCTPSSICGLTLNSVPSSTGSFNASFNAGTSFTGDNTFTLSVTDSHGESSTTSFDINANFFPQSCNDLNAGEICTIAGMPGMGDELDITFGTNQTKVRITPYTMALHNVGLDNKNLFISDYVNHVIWYWNRNTTSVQLGYYTIPPKSVKIVLGIPGYNAGMIYSATPNPANLYETQFGAINSTKINSFFLNGPTGLTVKNSGSTTELYIAEYGQNRMLQVQFNNSNSTLSIQPSASLGSCAPLDATVDTSSNKLYVTCNSSQQIRVLNLQTSVAPFSFQGTGQLTSSVVTSLIGSPYNDGVVNSTAYTSNVGSIFFDDASGGLFFTETNTCRLRILNPSERSSTINLFTDSANPVSVAPGNIKTIAGGNNAGTWCTQVRLGYFATPTTTQFGQLRGIVPYRIGGVLKGIFVSDYSYHRVIFINHTNASITIGNRTVAAHSAGIVFGLNNVAGSTNNNGANAGGKSSPLNSQLDIEVDNGTLFVADYGNNRIRTLNIDTGSTIVANGTVGTALGYIPRYGYNESPTLQSELVQFYNPGMMKFDATNNRLLISDVSNRRIRSLNLNNGVVDTIAGSGSCCDQTVQTSPLTSLMRTPYDIEILNLGGKEFPIYADFTYFIKAINIFGNIENILGTEVEPGKLNNIAGTNAPAGITNASPSYSLWDWWSLPLGDSNTGNLLYYNNQPSVVVPIDGPRGLGFDENSGYLYVSAYNDHCILKIDSTGIISVHSGLCTQANNQSGSFSNTRYRYPSDIEMDPLNPGNFFVIDQIDLSTSVLKYANNYSGVGSSRNILGQPVPGNSVGAITLSTTPNYATALAVNEYQVCIANGNNNNYSSNSVFCYSRAGSGSLSLYIGNRNSPTLGTTAFRGRPQKYNEDEGRGMGYFVDGDNIDPINNPSQLSDPQGLAFDSEGNLYISESRGHTIRMIKRWYP
jgi:hypothetical protein